MTANAKIMPFWVVFIKNFQNFKFFVVFLHLVVLYLQNSLLKAKFVIIGALPHGNKDYEIFKTYHFLIVLPI